MLEVRRYKKIHDLPETYTRWKKLEIETRWIALSTLKDMINIKTNPDLVLVYTDNKTALVLAALFMREVFDEIDNTLFDPVTGILYLYFGNVAKDVENALGRKEKIEQARKKTIELMDKYLNSNNLSNTKLDSNYQLLFDE